MYPKPYSMYLRGTIESKEERRAWEVPMGVRAKGLRCRVSGLGLKV